MRATMPKTIFAVLIGAGLAGCGSPNGGVDGGNGGDGPMGGDMAMPGAPVFKSQAITGCKQGGTQTVLAVRGSKVGIATIDIQTPACDLNNGGASCTACNIPMRQTAYVQNYDI